MDAEFNIDGAPKSELLSTCKTNEERIPAVRLLVFRFTANPMD